MNSQQERSERQARMEGTTVVAVSVVSPCLVCGPCFVWKKMTSQFSSFPTFV